MTHPNPQQPGHHRPPHAARPPVRAYFASQARPVDAGGYAVVPMILMEQMPPQWQHQMITLLDHLARQHQGAPWPIYRAQATARRAVTDCDERQLAAVGIEAECDDEGELIYRDTADGAAIPDPSARHILVPIPDPVMMR